MVGFRWNLPLPRDLHKQPCSDQQTTVISWVLWLWARIQPFQKFLGIFFFLLLPVNGCRSLSKRRRKIFNLYLSSYQMILLQGSPDSPFIQGTLVSELSEVWEGHDFPSWCPKSNQVWSMTLVGCPLISPPEISVVQRMLIPPLATHIPAACYSNETCLAVSYVCCYLISAP